MRVPDEVGGDEVGRELHARERAAEHAGGRLDREGLREAGHAFDEEMPLREKADEHPLEHRILTGDHSPDLEQSLLELLLRLGGRRSRPVRRCLGHVSPLSASSTYESRRV